MKRRKKQSDPPIKPIEDKPKEGRPTIYSDELASEICDRLSKGQTLISITARPDMPCYSTVLNWLHDESKAEFLGKYARARADQADYFAEDILAIADESQYDMTEDDNGKPVMNWEHVKRSQLKIDARKWFASKVAPKKYGEKITQEVTGADGAPFVPSTTTDMTKDEWARYAATCRSGVVPAAGTAATTSALPVSDDPIRGGARGRKD